jgi:very-short-patch-repair endonuclease
MIKGKKSLAETHPEVAEQWHPTLNENLTAFEVTAGSVKKIWWNCNKGNDHEWLSTPNTMTSVSSGCRVCSNRLIVKSNCLATTHSKLANEWHPFKNGNLTPFNIGAGSNKKVWWKCSQGEDHEWIANPNARSGQNQNCPICSNRKIVKSNCLATTHPNLALELHPTKNGNLTPLTIGAGSNKKVWWKCDKGDDHEWCVKPADRSNYNSGCPICSRKKTVLSNCLATTHPNLSLEWHSAKNLLLTPYDYTSGSNKKVWWKCLVADDHIYSSSIYKRAKRGNGCPYCAGRKVALSNCLSTTNPELAKEWHPTKNKQITPNDVYAGSNKKVWWKCEKGDDHEYKMPLSDRKRGHNCPICRGLTIVNSTSLAYTNPEYLLEWDYKKNKIKPQEIGVGSNKKVWWKCSVEKDHEWLVSPNSRYSQKSKCPFCTSRKVTLSNCLITTHPKISKEWHTEKNGELTPYDVGAFYSKRVWWKCDKGDDHEWYVKPTDRTGYNTGCPFCTLTPQSKQELTITFELMSLFRNIDPKGFKTRVKGKLWSIDIYIPKLKLGIEFDGSYWHKDKSALDKLKTEQIEDDGIEIFRIREEPLLRIFDDDIMSKQPFNAKQVTNDILTQIMSRYNLDTKKVAKIKDYQAKEQLQNERGLDRYIDKILTEKAEKKSSK